LLTLCGSGISVASVRVFSRLQGYANILAGFFLWNIEMHLPPSLASLEEFASLIFCEFVFLVFGCCLFSKDIYVFLAFIKAYSSAPDFFVLPRRTSEPERSVLEVREHRACAVQQRQGGKRQADSKKPHNSRYLLSCGCIFAPYAMPVSFFA